ncbi:MAG: translocation/assembly module TamB domain-containing protein, partial [Burkholderiaceae bacterium]
LLAALAGLLLLLLAMFAWLVGTESGAATALRFATSGSGTGIRLEGIHGRLAGRLRIDSIVWDTPDRRIATRDLFLHWRPGSLLQGRLHIAEFRIGSVELTSKIKKEDEPLRLPDSLAPPVHVQIDRLAVESGRLSWGPLKVLEIDGFEGALQFDGTQYLFKLDRLAANAQSEGNPFAAQASGEASLQANKPYGLNASFSSSGQATIQAHPVSAAGTLDFSGTLSELRAEIDASIRHDPLESGQKPPPPALAKGSAVLRPFADQLLGKADLSLLNLDLAVLKSTLPKTSLDLRLTADESGAGSVNLQNAAAGLLNEKALPLADLQVQFRQQEGQFIFSSIHALLGSAKRSAGRITGKGQFAAGALTLSLQTQALDLKKVDGRMRATRLAGSADIRHANGRQDISLALTETLHKNPLSLSMEASVADAQISIAKAELQAGQGSLSASGELGLEGRQDFRLQGKLSRFRPAELGDFAQMPPLLLNGDFTAQGYRSPKLHAQGEFSLDDSRIADQALQGKGRFQLQDDSLRIPGMVLTAGANRVNIQGELAQESSQLAFDIHAPQLAQLGPGFGGSLRASGTARGSLSRPTLVAEWQAVQGSLPRQVRLQATQGKVQLSARREAAFSLESIALNANARGMRSGDMQLADLSAQLQFSSQASAPLQADIRAQALSADRIRVENLRMTAQGTTGRHAIDIAINEAAQSWNIGAAGALRTKAQTMRWDGDIQRFEASGRMAARLLSPAPLSLSAKEIRLEDFRLNAEGGLIAVDSIVRTERRLSTRGRLEAVQLASLLRLAAPDAPVATDLQLDGTWVLNMGDIVNGALTLRRRQGDVTIRSGAPLALGISNLELNADASNRRLSVQLLADGRQLGTIRADASAGIANAAGTPSISPAAPLSGNVRIDLPNIGWIGPLASPSMLTEGRLQSTLTIAGSLNNPLLDGQINGANLRVQASDLGVDLRQGVLDASFTQTRMMLRQLRFQSANEGYLLVSGPVSFTDAKPDAQLRLEMQRFALLDRSDRRLNLTGSSTIVLAKGRSQINGDFLVDSGYFDIGRQDAPRLSEDVVIVGREKKQGAASLAALDVRVRLGKGIKLIGRGLDALLQGEVRFMNAAGDPLQADGTLRIAKGTYTAYGRELAIEHGALRFNGPINNPSLDILAMRRGQEVEAGVAVVGTVLAPRVTLVSDPAVPEAEKLSWLVLGRGLSSAGEADLGVLQSAAGALLSQRAASGVQSQIATAFGLDELGVSTSDDNLQQRIVTLGKQISSRLYVSYQRGLETASNALMLRYVISSRLALEAETGTRSVLSLFYNFSFD